MRKQWFVMDTFNATTKNVVMNVVSQQLNQTLSRRAPNKKCHFYELSTFCWSFSN